MINQQLYTSWDTSKRKKLKTILRKNPIRKLKPQEILVKNIYVPIHGSFWLASDPNLKHPRIDEFMNKGGFVFGNGGIAQVIKSSPYLPNVKKGDFVSIFGHTPCENYDCYACTVLHRYTECEYENGKILGHGKGSNDGTFAEYTILPPQSYEVCFKSNEFPTKKKLMPMMLSFLVADVRNALTRLPDVLKSQRMMLFGAGFSGKIAAYLFSMSSPGSKIFAIDHSKSRLKQLKEMIPCKVETFLLPKNFVNELDKINQNLGFRNVLTQYISKISDKSSSFFGSKNINLLMDCTSGNAAPLWTDGRLLKETTTVIPFGFGSDHIVLNKDIIQKSGLTVLMSRGVGNIRNRKETIELIKAVGSNSFFMDLLKYSVEKKGIPSVFKLIHDVHNNGKELPNEHIYMSL